MNGLFQRPLALLDTRLQDAEVRYIHTLPIADRDLQIFEHDVCVLQKTENGKGRIVEAIVTAYEREDWRKRTSPIHISLCI